MSELPETNDIQDQQTESRSRQHDVRRQRELFEKALQISSRKSQEDFIDEQCANEPEMANSVKSLLKSYSNETGNWLDNDLFETAFVERAASAIVPGTIIDGYEFKETLGSGGMGTVWLANQRDPVDRQVAIKLIQPGRETTGFLQRFDTERRALAAMNHPNIAAIYGAGKTDEGQPYFVMELVGGIPLNEFLANQKLSLTDRLELFLPVLQAVEHAHQKGIIHRDIKPSNVLVTEIDGQAVPKIIDFGLARALSDEQDESSELTSAGVLLGTPDYMAPEQARYGRQDVDIRSDVFSLGATLFEILTNARLHDNEKYRDSDLDGKLELIRAFEPTRPSSCLERKYDSQEILYSGLDHKDCAKLLRDELDWIVIKSLDNDKDRRYQSVGEFCSDLKRYLRSEPILAHPPSKYYVAQKFVRRNKGLVTAASSVAFALILGLIGTTYGLISANRATKVAIEQKNDAANARQAATLSATHEKEQRQYSEAIVDFLKNDFLLLTTVEGQLEVDNGENFLNKDASLTQLLDRAANKLQNRDDLDPKVRAELTWTVGASYRMQGDHEKAIEFLSESLEIWNEYVSENPEAYLNSANSLAVAYRSGYDFQSAIDILETALEEVADSIQVDPELRNASYRNLARSYREIGKADHCQSDFGRRLFRRH